MPVFPRNIPLFIAFRVAFNARWYYPVLAIIFLDFGLSLEQYALLNVAWAVSIVTLEVPSGAVADQIGRRRILILAGLFMVAEMALFAFAPARTPWLFPALLLNRILSGAAEACASGADESLAYDSLPASGREALWPAVLGRLMRWQSAAFFAAMLIGAAAYDAGSVAGSLGLHVGLTKEMTFRWPLYLTLGNAAVVLLAALAMHEPPPDAARTTPTIASTWRQTLTTGAWILGTPIVLAVILCGLWIDSSIRLFLTLGSNYYRLIDLPEATYGLIGASFAVVGIFTARLAEWMVARGTLRINFGATALLAFLGLLGLAQFLPRWGVLLLLPLGVAMSLLGFFLSHYLNLLVTDSARRATVLSFKGLTFNLAYGTIGLLFAGYTRARADAGTQDAVFSEAIRVLPWFFAALGIVVIITAARLLRRAEERQQPRL